MASSNQPFILIVDDNATNLSVLSQALKAVGYKVRLAMDGEDALAQVERAHPELILLDIQMPQMDGFETCRRLQENPETKGITVIFMTALADTNTKVKGLSVGAVDYITKPFEQEEVLARVKIHWRLKQLTDSLEQQVEERAKALQEAQLQLIQSEKMSALGNLVAGVAHEINNPISCIVGNINFMENYMNDVLGAIDLYGEKFPHPGAEIEDALDAIDLNHLREDLPKLIRAMKAGGDRITTISQSLRTFSRGDSDRKQPFNLHDGIESTLMILGHRLKANEHRPAIEVIQDYGDLPPIECFSGLLNQVFMNILANAIDTCDEAAQQFSFDDLNAHRQKITIESTLTEQNAIEIRICDNGKGMSEAVKARVFDHLFTTKGVGKGTGLGLAIAHQIVVDKHGGSLEVQSELGQGTEFCIRLPIAG